MFQSATVKLTLWYLCIVMVISLTFSVVIFQITAVEFEHRLESFRNRVETQSDSAPLEKMLLEMQKNQTEEARRNIIVGLVYANLIVLTGGGIASFLLARKTLRPIEEAHERESRFVSDASHELRTPLAAMKAEIEVILRDKAVSKKELQETLESNLEEVNNLQELSNTLLSLARGEVAALTRETKNLAPIIKRVVKRYASTGRQFIVNQAGEPRASVHEASITELIGILIDNAVRYSEESSPINIALHTQKNEVLIEVCNTGDGIEQSDLPYIFDRFYQGDSARRSEGYGLGLSLAKRIIDAHEGAISVTSVPGKETIFSVILPLVSMSEKKHKK